jgi:hypothetical protein
VRRNAKQWIGNIVRPFFYFGGNMPNVFDFRPRHSITNVNPQAAGEELERIRAQKGKLVPSYIVEAAVDPESPLHNAFEWNDARASQEHRLNQARRLVSSIRVLNSPTAKPIRAFVTVRTPDHGRTYMPTVEAMSDADLRERVLAEIRNSIESIEQRYAHFVEIRDLLAQLKNMVG